MNLTTLFAGFDIAVPSVSVCDLTTDSRQAVSGGLFLACAGSSRHGLDYLDTALSAGVSVVAWEPQAGVNDPQLPAGVVGIKVPGLRQGLGELANRFFGNPSAALSVTGVTGTNGKTTTAWLVTQALMRLSQAAGYMGTLGYGVGADLQPSELTTPGCIEVHRRLRELADTGASHVVAEVSSHALDQQRVDGVAFRVAALTNISRDHLDYHGTMQRYAEAKARLFLDREIDTAVINIGDRYGAELAKGLADATQLVSVALVDTDCSSPNARLVGSLTSISRDGLSLQFAGDFGQATLHSPLWGRFNAENLAMSAGILLALGYSLADIVRVLGDCPAPPGRMELVHSENRSPTVIVDFAHTPDALGKALETIREHATGAVWCVFGCGGERDTGKRAPMGAVAASLADRAVVTDDNPRTENPDQIIAAIVAGVGQAGFVEVVRDRAAAIEHAIRSAGEDDIVLIAGKGHEAMQIIGAESRAFSDRAIARAALDRVA